jgi:tetratricopeptide (TPR) repeat protein
MVSPEAMIKSNESQLFELIPSWVRASRGVELQLGGRVTEVMGRAIDLRREIGSGRHVPLDLESQSDSSDVLHAFWRLLMEDCLKSPGRVFEEAVSTVELLRASRWIEDDLEEREGLLCSFIFVAWRAARILDFSKDAQRWESEYNQLFRCSLFWSVTEAALEFAGGQSTQAVAEVVASGPEAILQALLYLRDRGEAAPELAAQTAIQFCRSIEVALLGLPEDLQPFFLGESARLAGNLSRIVGNLIEVERWAELSETYFRNDRNPSPSLARVAFLRMTLAYEQSRWDLIVGSAEELDRLFAELGMEEDRIKCRVTWAASLKLAGRFPEALEVLEPLRLSKKHVRPGLYGWVMLHSGDIHQICGKYELALEELIEAASLLQEGKQLTGLSDVKGMISCIYRSYGLIEEALQLLKSGCEEHARLGLASLVANDRILIAETYLAMGRPRDAEVEIRAAIPVFEEQGMVADAVVAVNLLREAIRRQRSGSQVPNEARPKL